MMTLKERIWFALDAAALHSEIGMVGIEIMPNEDITNADLAEIVEGWRATRAMEGRRDDEDVL